MKYDIEKVHQDSRGVLFLDIETTGLSRHYDYVTVIGYDNGDGFHYSVYPHNTAHFKKALAQAHTIVTFNGTLFDVKFLQHHFTDLVFPENHIDLRYLLRRCSLTGGQKKIEVELGLKREEDIRKVTGYEAVVLWHEYRRGSKEALQQLLSYNHADVQGMKFMLEHGLRELYGSSLLFLKTNLVHKKVKEAEKPKPKVYLKDLTKKVKGNSLVVGIDLTGSEERPSGFAVLYKDGTVYTKQVLTDKEIISHIVELNPSIVSIDSPLGIPKGRKKVTDDDPGRNLYGIMRQAEKELKRRGVNVYPCLIPSMQRLTARGMRITKKLREKGYKVIESYPGAAQDIMQIPRKHAGLPYLKEGLHEFGIVKGHWYHEKVSHDELDAITSAIVGLFYEANMYEALGNDDEEYLVIPKV